jgi:cytochrome c553
VKCFVSVCLLWSLIACPALAASSKTPTQTNNKTVAVAPTAQGDVAAGKSKSEDERCQECHGSDGNGNRPEGKFPKLAGQYPEYMVKQLQNYRTGERKYDFMTMLVRSMEDADLADISAYYANQKIMHGDGSGDNSVGKNLFVNGDAGRSIFSCVSCHGAVGTFSENIRYPVIGGQERNYLANQIAEWRSGERKNSKDGVMNSVAKSLTDTEIQALADYISGL